MRTDLEHKGLTYCALVMVRFLKNGCRRLSAEAMPLLNPLLSFWPIANPSLSINRSDNFRADEITVEKVLQKSKNVGNKKCGNFGSPRRKICGRVGL